MRRCPGCNYDLRTHPFTGTCPECGRAYLEWETRSTVDPRRGRTVIDFVAGPLLVGVLGVLSARLDDIGRSTGLLVTGIALVVFGLRQQHLRDSFRRAGGRSQHFFAEAGIAELWTFVTLFGGIILTAVMGAWLIGQVAA